MIELDEARTVRHESLSSGRMEAWEATSADGRWHFHRLEDTGTPWEVTHDDFPGWAMLAPSLDKATAGAERQLHLDLTVNLPDGPEVRGGAGSREVPGPSPVGVNTPTTPADDDGGRS